MTGKGIIALALCATAMPALAQSLDGSVATLASRVAAAKTIPGQRADAVNGKLPAVTTPWTPTNVAEMAQTVAPADQRRQLSLSARVDFNGDGAPDVAYMANAKAQNQRAVIVQLGGGKGQVVAYRTKGQWGGNAEIVAAGQRRILVNFPGSSVVILSAEGGRPQAYYVGN